MLARPDTMRPETLAAALEREDVLRGNPAASGCAKTRSLPTSKIARRYPVRLIESGPAAGALMAANLGQRIGEPNLLAFDMGGTTAKGALIRNGRPLRRYEFEVAREHDFKQGSGLPLRIPVIDMIEIGAGGGSIANVDERNLLAVGPKSAGAARPIDISAPDHCILNAQPPWATGGRHSVGHFVVPLLMGAMAPALPDRVQADAAMMNVFSVQGHHRDGEEISSLFFLAGGLGAMLGQDGRAVTPAPSNMTVVPTEVWENRTSITIEKREILPDTGGDGKWRGGDGQEVVFRNDTGYLLEIALMGQRTEFAAKGLQGGDDGALCRYEVNGQLVDPKSRVELSPGDRISMREAGGGFGSAAERRG